MPNARISCHVADRIGEIHPFIYGHFVEHLAECIYGGLWAEMLANRKFAGHDQPPSERPTVESYGIPHPWHAVNRGPNVRYTHDNTIYYNALQSQRIDLYESDGMPHGVAQAGLVLQAGRSYEVRLVLSQGELGGAVRVALSADDGVVAEHIYADIAPAWRTYTCTLVADRDVDDAQFSVTIDRPGKLWIGTASLMPADHLCGWRRDVVELVRQIRPPIVRYPGGNFVSGYHWADGVGDRDSRPIRYDDAWKVWEPNDVGIDEFMVLCDLLNCEPYISVNAGNGTAAEAAAWVEYCNGAPNTVYGAKRAANGHSEPYGIKYWGIGNEMYGNWQIGHVDPETFGRRHVEFARVMRAVDPEIILLGVGDMPDGPGEWLEIVTDLAGEYIDLMTVHHYTRVPEEFSEPARNALTVACPQHLADLLLETRRVLDERGPEGHQIDISFDEWNVVHQGVGRRQNYALRDGLYAAALFNAMQRQCDRVTMANVAQLVNLLGTIETNQVDAYGTPLFLAFKLYVDHCGEIALRTRVEGETFDVPAAGSIPALTDVPYLDASASLSPSRNCICLAVVNRHQEQAITADVEIAGADLAGIARCWELNGPDMGARNTFDDHDVVTLHDRGERAVAASFEVSFPAHSATVLEIDLRS